MNFREFREFRDFKEALFADALKYGFTDFEIYYSSSNGFAVKIFQGEIAEYKSADCVGLSFRGTYNNRIGYAFSEKAHKQVIPDMLKNAAENASIIEEKEIEKLYPGDAAYPKVDCYNPALADVDSARKIELALAMEKYAYSLDARVKSIDYCQLGTSEGTVNIANSYGMDISNRSNLAYAYIVARIEENGTVKTGMEMWHGNDFEKFSYEKVAKGAVDRALSYLNAESVLSASYPIIFDNRTAASLMASFSSVFFAENAQKGFSLLAGKEGEKIAAPNITLRDDADGLLLADCETFGSVPFDSEGVAAQKKAVIEDGVLKTLLYNTKSAAKANKTSTGNGFRSGFRSSITTACTNFYIVPSSTSPEQMQAQVKKGIFITEMAGLHAGVNPISGDFSISSDGFLIENGKITRPVEQITVAGNFFSLLKDIECVGSDLRFNVPGSSGTFGMPSILVRELPVSGL